MHKYFTDEKRLLSLAQKSHSLDLLLRYKLVIFSRYFYKRTHIKAKTKKDIQQILHKNIGQEAKCYLMPSWASVFV